MTMNVPHPLTPPPGSFDIPFPGKFFLDLFAGKNAPIFNACQLLRADVLTPLELELGWDILDDTNYERILHAAWNGFIGGMWSAPPCREYSRLKLKQPGPKPLRTPKEPTGRADLTHHEQLRLQTQETIHDRGRVLLTAAHSKGALVGWETPPSAMTLLLKDNTEMLRDWNASCSHVAACHWGMNFSKSWLLCSNDADISSLASWCTCPHQHPSFAGLRTPSGGYELLDSRVPFSPCNGNCSNHDQEVFIYRTDTPGNWSVLTGSTNSQQTSCQRWRWLPQLSQLDSQSSTRSLCNTSRGPLAIRTTAWTGGQGEESFADTTI